MTRLLLGAASILVVPLCSIVGHEVWQMTTHLRYPVGLADPNQVMKAASYASHGARASDVLTLETVRPQPHQPASPGFIVIRVAAAALNPVDFKQMRSWQPDALVPKPRIAGFDVSGVVVSAGKGTPFEVGDAVFGMLPLVGSPWGALAELTVAHASCFAHAPKSIPLEDASALPLVGLTVMQVFEQAGLFAVDGARADGTRTEQSVLIHAAAGGVGSIAVQYARNILGFGRVVGQAPARHTARSGEARPNPDPEIARTLAPTQARARRTTPSSCSN